MEQKNNICSRSEVERYLLNKMSADEETLFQQHLTTCQECNAYLQTLRNLAGFVGSDNMQQIDFGEEKEKRSNRRSIYYWISTAASILLIFGISFYFLNKGSQEETTFLATTDTPSDTTTTIVQKPVEASPIETMEEQQKTQVPTVEKGAQESTLHDLSITHQHRAMAAEAEVAPVVLFPQEAIISHDPADGPLVFKWNKTTTYQILIQSGEKMLVEEKGTGNEYTLNLSQLGSAKSIDWQLTVDSKEWKGRIFIK